MPRFALVPPVLTVSPFRGTGAAGAGLITRRRLTGSAWVRLLPDIYAYAEVPLTHRVWYEAAILLLPKGSAIAGESAATLWGVKGVSEPDRVHVVVPRRVRPHPGLEIHRGPIAASDITEVFGLPVTVPERAALDLARFLPRTGAVIW